MPQWLQWTLIIGGVIAIALLLVFIRRHAGVLSASRRRQEKAEAFQNQRRQNMIESIQVIAMAVETEQVEYSEACLRLKGLLDHVQPELLQQPPFQVFQQVHEKLQHMPTHRARQETDTRFVQKMDKERFEVEKLHADEILRAASAIRKHSFEA